MLPVPLHLLRRERELAEDEFAALAGVLGYIPDSKKVLAFTRLKKGKEIFHSRAYKKVTVTCRNSYTMLYWVKLMSTLTDNVFFSI